LWIAWVLGIDIRLGTYFPRWSWLPLQFSLVLGLLVFFYVLKITRPQYKFRWRDLLHFKYGTPDSRPSRAKPVPGDPGYGIFYAFNPKSKSHTPMSVSVTAQIFYAI